MAKEVNSIMPYCFLLMCKAEPMPRMQFLITGLSRSLTSGDKTYHKAY